MQNSRAPRMFGRVVKFSLLLLVLLVNGVLIFRLCSSGDPVTMQNLIINEPLKKAYAEHGDDLILQYQNQSTITRGEHNSGYFSVTQYVFIPEAKQVQLVFRYNNSTIKHLMEDYKLSALPSKEEELFDVTLVMTTDLTPENTEDNLDPSKLEKLRLHPTAATRDITSNSLYTYYRFVFDGVEVSPETVGVFADIYYEKDINDYQEEAYGTLCLYDNLSKWIKAELTDADRAALSE